MSDPQPAQRIQLPDSTALNAALVREFQACESDPALRRSHLFEGRYENVYATEEQMPSLAILLTHARREASARMQQDPALIGIGYWINAMYPGHVTLRHSHDDFDEALSGVYYVQVPTDSGDLLLHLDSGPTRIEPVAGSLVLFSPTLEHEVTRHQGVGLRLSIAMNFGVRQ